MSYEFARKIHLLENQAENISLVVHLLEIQGESIS